MRFYSLEIDGVTWFKLDEKNASALRLVFNISNYNEYSPSSNLNFITLYNTPLSFIKAAKSFEKKRVKLKAGLKSLGFSSKIYKGFNSLSDTLFEGSISSVFTQFNSKEVATTFLLGELEQYVLAEDYEYQINADNPIANEVKNALLDMFKIKGLSVTVDPNTLSVKSQTTQTLKIKPSKNSPLQAVTAFCLKYGLVLSISGLDIRIHKKDKTSQNSLVTHYLKTTDFLAQPQYENLSQVSMSLVMNPALTIGQTIIIPPEVTLNAEAFINDISQLSAVATLQNNKPLSLIGGIFEIVQVNHVGDSRSSAAENWGTQILAISKGIR